MTIDTLRITATSSCPQCRGMLAVNRLEPSAFCTGCGHETPIAPATWSQLLREAIVAAPAMPEGTTRGSTVSGITLQYRRRGLLCLTCDRPVDFARGRCEPCGTAMNPRPANATPYASILGEIAYLYGEAPARGASVSGPGSSPTASDTPLAQYPCESCGAPLPLAGNTQTIVCTFCHRTAHVPLRFLYRGHRELPEPWALIFSQPLARAGDVTLGAHFDWLPSVMPTVFSLGEGRVLISGERHVSRSTGSVHQDKRFLLVLEAGAGGVPRVVWTRSDLILAEGSDDRPQMLSPGSTRLLVRTHAGVFGLDARTGDTVTVVPIDARDADTFRSWSIELAGAGRLCVRGHELRGMAADDALSKDITTRYRKVKNAERIFVADHANVLTAQAPDHPRRLVVRLVDSEGNVVAQGEQPVRNDDVSGHPQWMSVSMTAGKIWAGIQNTELYVAPFAAKLSFTPVPTPKTRGPGLIVGFGDGFAIIGDRGSFRAFDAQGTLLFDSATLQRPA